MVRAEELKAKVENGAYDARLTALYGEEALAAQRARYSDAIGQFIGDYGPQRPATVYSAPGRTEIGGNHTDHNNGIVMAAAVNLDIIAVVSPNEEGIARVRSEGFGPADVVDLKQLEPQAGEEGHSASLLRGIAAGFARRGGRHGGFDAYTTSDVLKGSGLSSSAAFEVCMAAVVNGLYNGGRFAPVELAQISQYAENTYFGKPSGLMDQTSSAVGSAVKIDFADPASPVVQQVPLDLAAQGYSLVITDTGGDHADLTPDYAAIRSEMEAAAACFGKQVLRQVARDTLFANIPRVRAQAGDRAALRAMHFFEECRRAELLAEYAQKGDMPRFLETIIEGGHSSFEYNQNAYSPTRPAHQGVPIALALSQHVLAGCGAWRLQGGGFAGTIQAFVPAAKLAEYTATLGAVFGAEACHVLRVRAAGCTEVTAG